MASNVRPITEEEKVHKEWYKEAREITAETFPEFMRKLMEDYGHDYGTICHACSAAGVAAANVINRSPTGGITGFQAGCVMWGFISHWMQWGDDEKHYLGDYANLLYPQYENKFNAVSQENWNWIQERAKSLLASSTPLTHPDVLAHWESIVAGKVPFSLKISKD